MNKSGRFIVIAAVFALLALIGASFAQAQDATATTDTSGTTGTTAESTAAAGSMVQCDADLITNLYIAEHFFGFDQVANQMMTNGSTSMVDLNTIDKGQFNAWFNTPMSGTGPWTTDQVNSVSSMLAMDDATLQSTMMNGATPSTTLNPVSVAGENPTCTQLRTELTRFFDVIAYESATGAISMPSMSSTPMAGETTGSGAEATPEMTATTSG